MLLNKLTSKKRLVILGLNSGTSVDSLDMAVVSINVDNNKVKFISGKEVKYPKTIKNAIDKFNSDINIELDELIYFDNILGRFYGQKAKSFLKQLEKKNFKVDAIASHGQTVRHLPSKKNKHKINGTLQMGSPEFISDLTGKVVISDFRQADIAHGGEGAPITTSAVKTLFESDSEPRLIVNIGGMSNFFFLSEGKSKKPVTALDCGPGNSLIDILTKKIFKLNYDKYGHLAKKGNISKRLLTLLLSEPFYKGKLKSTGKEQFGEKMADKIIKLNSRLKLSGNDLIATVTELTVQSIGLKLLPLLKKEKNLKKIYLTGGGRKNIFLKDRLSKYFNDLEILNVEKLTLNGDYVEAISYAVLGSMALKSKPAKIGMKKEREVPVLGRITQPPR